MDQHPECYTIGSGIPVVLLHSSMSSKEQWGKLMDVLQEKYQVIAIDLYGYGVSPLPPNGFEFTLLQEAERIQTIIKQFIGDVKFHLLGHSYGAATALRFAYDHQEQLLSLSLYEPVAFHLLAKDDPALLVIVKLAEQIKQAVDCGDLSTGTRIFVDFWSGGGTYANIHMERQRSLNRYIQKVLLDFQAGIYEPLTIDDYARLQLPTCLIAGRKSPPSTRKIVENIARTLPQLEMHWIDGGHMAPITHAATVNRIWVDFLANISTTAICP
ncbi:alpha/beta fold hydrolase [Desulfopila aestuarii]|uniref:Pimeloyl-ACP methyl ester carboxylesterase n=1 Tax=Desulfopila aestuarii DSM 18488 TaxID=1121416 RepID=A0A1M7YGC5_9BACT|nr:alpha/beta hydrolase [Desulfopila aestuarii]SHO51568.1 Pimeloyl-ACP methyl ester carboxylesterase [Desulfopila aestuarii DSM 18488]